MKIPHSPFATRLSGSAKETELRLRSIFQWKKKRPPMVLLILAALIALSCGGLVSCQPRREELSADSNVGDGATPENLMQEKPATQKPMNSVTYVTFDSRNAAEAEAGTLQGYFPVSRIEDGVQILTGSIRYQDAWDSILSDIPEADNLNKHDSIASNGTWDFFPVKVEQEIYTLENQPEQAEWTAYFQEKLSEAGSPDTPVIITEAWIFNWNGTETAVVNASNVIASDDDSLHTAGREDEPVQPNPPPGEHTILYRMSALFLRGNAPIDLVAVEYGNSQEVSHDSDYNTDLTKTGISYLPPDSGPYQQLYSAVQFGANGNLTVCPVFVHHGGELNTRHFQYSPALYLVCDTDGDGAAELIQGCDAASSLLRSLSVYQLIDGKPECVFSLAG